MANVRDGSINDKTVNEIIQFGNDVFSIRHAEAMDDDTDFTYIFPSDVIGTHISAGEIKAANISNNTDSVTTGQVVDNEGNTYFLHPLTTGGDLVLLLMDSEKKDDVNKNSKSEQTISLTPDAYLKYLNVYL